MKSTCSTDHNGFPSILIKQLTETLSYPLSLIYSSLMFVDNLPGVGKRATVMLVFESQSSSLVKNYRSISPTQYFFQVNEASNIVIFAITWTYFFSTTRIYYRAIYNYQLNRNTNRLDF